MCGILGLITANTEKYFSKFDKSLDLLTHRGPDYRGVWKDKNIILGHRRLSIIDVSKLGNQPMIDKKSNSILIFNGEIYNYKELAQELIGLGYKFISNSDTEVLLYSLIEWGTKAIPKLNGMWAFAYWSLNENKLIISRDRFGVKPLYFYKQNMDFVFASEPKAILNLFTDCKKINEDVFKDFIVNSSLYNKGKSFYHNIEVFPSAHYGIYNLHTKKLELHRFWDYPNELNHNLTEKLAIEEFTYLLEQSVKLRLRSDVPVAASLSGGLDSTAILAGTNSLLPKTINSYTSIYEKKYYDEYKWAQKASDLLNSKLIPVEAKSNNWIKTLKKIVWHMDGPGYSPAVYPLWNLVKKAKSDGVKVILDGQGADEALAGYNQYMTYKNLFNQTFFLSNNGFTSKLGLMIKFSFPKLFNFYKKKIGIGSFLLKKDNVFSNFDEKKNKNSSIKDILQKDHSLDILPGLLHYGDSISMAHGVEIRNPFLDYRLVEWIFKLPENLLFNKNQSKWVLREYLRNKNLKLIADRKKKDGYSTPVKYWINSLSTSEKESYLLSNNGPIAEWFDKKKIQKLLKKNQKKNTISEFYLYKFISAQVWINQCIESND